VEKSKSITEKLTIQMSAFAKSISDHPPIRLQYRSKIIADIEKVHEGNLSSDVKRSNYIRLKEEWENNKNYEQMLQHETVKKCLQAAQLGMEVRRLIDKYSKLSLEDLNYIVSAILDEAGNISGKDFGELKLKSNEVFEEIKQDPIWNNMAETVLSEINNEILASSSGSNETLTTSTNKENETLMPTTNKEIVETSDTATMVTKEPVSVVK